MAVNMIEQILDTVEPLAEGRKTRFPLYVWRAADPPVLTEARARELITELDVRGIALIVSWDPAQVQESLEKGLLYGRLQQQANLGVTINANACVHGFSTGEAETAHIDGAGRTFFDPSIPGPRKIGCPFAVEHRSDTVRAQLEPFLDAYDNAGVVPTFVFADWEIDGPLEINQSHRHAQRCVRCHDRVPGIGDFRAYRDAVRTLRCQLTRACYAEPVLRRFPQAHVGNYAVYPHDGYRYWYDWFESYDEGQPAIREQGAIFREWFDEYPLSGYTVAMPVVYTWARTHGWFDFDDSDYRWFYGLMKAANNAGSHASRDTPVVSFVHWHTTALAHHVGEPPPQMSARAYQELLRHMLLRGTDALFLWCPQDETAQEVQLVHEVFRDVQRYAQIVDYGQPMTFETPRRPDTVISTVGLDGRTLSRRSGFGESVGDEWTLS